MAEWFKAARLKRDSPGDPLKFKGGGGRNVVTEHKGTWVRRPEGEAEGAEPCDVPRFAGYRAKRASTSLSLGESR